MDIGWCTIHKETRKVGFVSTTRSNPIPRRVFGSPMNASLKKSIMLWYIAARCVSIIDSSHRPKLRAFWLPCFRENSNTSLKVLYSGLGV